MFKLHLRLKGATEGFDV